MESEVAQFKRLMQEAGIHLTRLRDEEIGSSEKKAGIIEQYLYQIPEYSKPIIKDKDSLKYQDAVKNDPFFHNNDSLSQSLPLANNARSSAGYNPLPPGYTDPNEYKVAQKLSQLNAVINNSNNDNSLLNNRNNGEQNESSVQTKEVDRLEQMVKSINQPDSSTDPETAQLNNMMDKILDIQHPERVGERLQQQSEKDKTFVYPVVTKESNAVASLLQNNNQDARIYNKKRLQPQKQIAFYSLQDDIAAEDKQNIIEAEIQQTQTIVSGSTVKLSSATDVYVNGILVPKGTLLYGIASQNGERLNIVIPSIRYGNNLLRVSLSVYDLDGLAGIYIPGSISRDAAKQSGSEALSNMGITSLDPSLAAQAAGAGIQAAKALINKKVKQVKVTIKAGYQVLLKDDNQK